MLRYQLREIPFVKILIPFLAGILVALYFPSIQFSNRLLLVVPFLLIAARHHDRYYRRYVSFLLTLLLFGAGLLFLQSRNELTRPDHFSHQTSAYLAVCINETPQVKKNLVRFPVKVEWAGKQKVCGKLLVTIVNDSLALKLQYGDRLLIPYYFKETESPGNPGEFDYKAYLANKNIYHYTFLQEGRWKLLKQHSGFSFIAYSCSVAKQVTTFFAQAIANKEASSVLSALLIGYRDDLDKGTISTYTDTGVLHILSVSGLHVGLIFIVLNFMLGFLNRYDGTKLFKLVLIALFIWFYAFIAGLAPSVVRSAVMISFILIAQALNRDATIYNSIAASAFVQLCYDPYMIADVGFQLSYLAVLGIVSLQPLISSWWEPENRIVHMVWKMVAVSVAAQLFTLPFSLYYFHQFPLYFVPANLVAIPLSTLVLYGGLLLLAFSWFSWVSSVISLLLEKLILLMNGSLSMIKQAPFSTFQDIWMDRFEWMICCLLVLLLTAILLFRSKRLVFAWMCCALFYPAYHIVKSLENTRQPKLVIHHTNKNRVVTVMKDRSALILSDKKTEQSLFDYSIKPTLGLSGVQSFQELCLDSQFRDSHVFLHRGFLQAGTKRLCLFTNNLIRKDPTHRIRVDYLVITGREKVSLSLIKKSIDFDMLVIAGNRPAKWLNEAKQLNVKAYSTYKSGALTIAL